MDFKLYFWLKCRQGGPNILEFLRMSFKYGPFSAFGPSRSPKLERRRRRRLQRANFNHPLCQKQQTGDQGQHDSQQILEQIFFYNVYVFG